MARIGQLQPVLATHQPSAEAPFDADVAFSADVADIEEHAVGESIEAEQASAEDSPPAAEAEAAPAKSGERRRPRRGAKAREAQTASEIAPEMRASPANRPPNSPWRLAQAARRPMRMAKPSPRRAAAVGRRAPARRAAPLLPAPRRRRSRRKPRRQRARTPPKAQARHCSNARRMATPHRNNAGPRRSKPRSRFAIWSRPGTVRCRKANRRRNIKIRRGRNVRAGGSARKPASADSAFRAKRTRLA